VPIYEYKCKKKGHVFELIQSFSDKEAKKCPTCGGPVEKLVSASAFHLKGSGWYVTDFKNPAKTSPTSGADKSLTSDKPEQTSATSASEPVKEVKSTKNDTKKKD
jgi:putative FmdB family regulatory protein